MRKLRTLSVVAMLIGVVLAAPLGAGEADDVNLEILRDTIRANKKAFVAVNLGLSDAEAKAFWPAYDGYQADLQTVEQRFAAVITDYADNFGGLSDDKAMELIGRYLALERERADVRQRHLEPIAAALPGKKVARFYQIENKIEALFRYELAATIPVVE
jgi:hypothetical protein